MPAERRTTSQNRRIWGLANELARLSGGGQAEARAAISGATRQVADHEHSSRLSRRQAVQVIKLLEERVKEARKAAPSSALPPKAAPASRRKPRGRTGARNGPITPRQQALIDALYRQVGWTERARQIGFSKRQTGSPWPQTQADADKIVEGLKAMLMRTVTPQEAWGRAEAIKTHSGLNPWQAGFVPDLVEQFRTAKRKGSLDKVLSPHKLLKLIEAEVACGVVP